MSKLTKTVGTRIEPRVLSAFSKKASKFGGVGKVLRELIIGFSEDRVVIHPPKPTGIYAINSEETLK